MTKIFKALSDPNRVRALYALQRQALCVCQIVELLRLAPSTVSKHMSILANAGLVESSKRGRWVYYRQADPNDSQVGRVLGLLPDLVQKEDLIKDDHKVLARILTLDPETLCRMQSERTESPNV